MLIKGLVDIQDLSTPNKASRYLRSYVMSKKVDETYFLSVKNSKYPNTINYKVSDIEVVHVKFLKDGKMGIRFRQPKHLVLLRADEQSKLNMFAQQIEAIMDGKNVNIGTRHMPKAVLPKVEVNRFDPDAKEFVAIDRFDQRILNMVHLNKLILENCNLPSLPEKIGYLPLNYLSLAGSNIYYKASYEKDTYWNWMTIDVIGKTLSILKMDSIKLKFLPYEIKFLQNIHALSLSNNKLIYIPHFIGELRKLKCLFVADNRLKYLPDCLFLKTFNELDISNNFFSQIDTSYFDHIDTYVKYLKKKEKINTDEPRIKKLSHLSLCSLFENHITFKRQDIPRSLWIHFDLISRCIQCQRNILPEYSRFHHATGSPSALKLVRNQVSPIEWQTVFCAFRCGRY